MPYGMFTIVWVLFFSIILTFSFLGVVIPKKMWKVSQGWKAVSEPSDTYFLIQRIFSGIVFVIALYMFAIPWFMRFMPWWS